MFDLGLGVWEVPIFPGVCHDTYIMYRLSPRECHEDMRRSALSDRAQ